MKKIALALMVVGLVGCGKSENGGESSSLPTSVGPKKISEYAYSKYTEDQFPTTFKNWGGDWIVKIEQLERDAANKIANESNSCDFIDMVGLSDNKSTPKQEAVVFVDCGNGERFYVSNKDVEKKTVSKSQSEKSISIDSAFDKCMDLVRTNTKHPSTVDFKVLDSNGFTAKTTGNVVITLGFTAKNSLGAELPAKAKCIFTPDGESELSFLN